MTNSPPVAIDSERLWARHMAAAQLGATAGGGVNRGALTAPDIELHRQLAELAHARSFSILVDDYGNTFFRRAGSDPHALAVVSGSHSDTQPSGGRFDGIFGVLAAFEALEAIDDAGIDTRAPLEVVIWNNEEGERFRPSQMGSAVYTGVAELAPLLAATDDAGRSMDACVQALRSALAYLHVGRRALGEAFAVFVEAHIEQGPILEAARVPIGVVSGIQGTRKFEIEVIGDAAHAGTMPRSGRRDAFVDAIAIVNRLHEMFHDAADEVRFTIGRFDVYPGALAVVPERVWFSVDFRHPDEAVLVALGDALEPAVKAAVRCCEVLVKEPVRARPTQFTDMIANAIIQAADRRGLAWRSIYSGAGHDARYMAAHCPTGMLFIPCDGGISHNERENAQPEHVAAGAQVITDVMLELATRARPSD
jgi:beta-ureidopropionase / N-carbamoyl-L-amino-acid hydrolase